MKNVKIFGLSGGIGSGKNTVADILTEKYGFEQISFAQNLKQVLSVIFGWNQSLLEGSTKISRQWREQPDEWWAKRLSIPHFTPRWALQHVGTEVFRQSFHPDIWVASLEKKLLSSDKDKKFVLTDLRMPNEFEWLHRMGGESILVTRSSIKPEWYSVAAYENTASDGELCQLVARKETMFDKFPDVHFSEYGWAGMPIDHYINNHADLGFLEQQVQIFYEKISAKSSSKNT